MLRGFHLIITTTTATGLKRRGHLFVPLFSGRVKRGESRWGMRLDGVPVPEKTGETITMAPLPGGFDSVTLISMGADGECSAEDLRGVGGSMARVIAARRAGVATVDMAGPLSARPEDGVGAVCEGLSLGSFRFDRHKTEVEARPRVRVSLAFPRDSKRFGTDIRRAGVVSSGVNYARGLAHEPANVINPVTLAGRARALAKSSGLRCRILDHRKMAGMKMGAMLAVGQASASPPRLIVLEYGGRRGGKPVVLVGKAITFDTGGYSLKDKTGIVGMKYDKCGGVAVLGVMKAVAALKPKVPVVGVVAAAENMIGGNAYRPNDIIRSMSGKTIEIISTDAEGRLVLADALTYAQKHYQPRAIIDLATLTGGVVVALGKVCAGLFCNEEGLRDQLLAAGERTHERLWSLPMHDDYLELIRGDDCDLKNSATREAHACVGAIFLKQFVDQRLPWAHLDIAGVASIDKATAYCPKGGTGFGVRLLCDYLEGL